MANIYNILIAEDEPHIAMALGAVVKKGVSDSVVTVVSDGEEALEKLLAGNYHLIISDWNMPKMTGAELLGKVRDNDKLKQLPFMMLTARGDKDSVISAMKGGVTEYIAKPFENQVIVEKAKNLLIKGHPVKKDKVKSDTKKEGVVEEESIVSLLAKKLKNGDIEFPIMPEIGIRASELSKNDETSVEDLSLLISQDAALSSKIINIANSARYGGGKNFDSVDDAVSRIGFREVSNIIIAICNKNMYQKVSGVFSEKLNLLWQHSFATAACAKVLAWKIENENPDRAFMVGMLHDIGKLVLLTILFELSRNREIKNDSLDGTVSQLHVQFGIAIIDRWNMPKDYTDVVANHHDLENMASYSQLTQIVAFSNLLVRKLGYSLVEDDGFDLANSELAKLLGLDDSKIEKILQQTKLYIDSTSSII